MVRDFIPWTCHCLRSPIFLGTFPLIWDGIIWFLCPHWPYYCLPLFFSWCTLLHCFPCCFSNTTVLAGPTSQNALSHVSARLLPSHVSSFFGETGAETDHFIPTFLVLFTLRPLFPVILIFWLTYYTICLLLCITYCLCPPWECKHDEVRELCLE